MKAGVVGTYRYSDTPAGNNMRIRVPLSRKLNPGDSIWMIFWVQTPISTLSAAHCLNVGDPPHSETRGIHNFLSKGVQYGTKKGRDFPIRMCG